MFVVLSEHVSKAPPGGCIRVVDAQGLAVALLGGLPPHLPLRSPQVTQVVVHINLSTNMPPLTEMPPARPGCSFMHSYIKHTGSVPGFGYEGTKSVSAQQKGQKCSMKSPLGHVEVMGIRAVCKGRDATPDGGCNP